MRGDTGFKLETLTNGDYKLMIEPIMYITYNGVKTVMTATEAALYNQLTGGDLINKFGPLSHKNLPLRCSWRRTTSAILHGQARLT